MNSKPRGENGKRLFGRDPTNRLRCGEEGYMLLAAIFLLALLLISLSVALPKISKEIQRDRELETMNRGKQYIRAIKMYYRKFGSYPPNVDALVKPSGPGNLRFLRKKYVDPTTGKDEWKPIRFGQAKTQTMGFFGQPLAGTGSAGGSLLAGVGPGASQSLMSTTGFGGTGTGISSGLTGSNPVGVSSGSGTSGAADSSSATAGTAGDSSASGGISAASGSSQTGQTFGGVGIVGFSPTSPKQSILVYKKKNHYNEWEFVYDPLADRTMAGGGAVQGAQPASGMSSTPVPTTPFGSSGLGGLAPTSTPATPTPSTDGSTAPASTGP